MKIKRLTVGGGKTLNLVLHDSPQKYKTQILWNRVAAALIVVLLMIFGLTKFIGNDNKKTVKNVSASTSSKTEESTVSSVNLKVCIDAGHGGNDVGTLSSDGNRYEKDDNLNISFLVEKYLKNMGVTVVMTREDDSFVELEDRCKIAENANADMFICLHRNSYDGDISGVEAWVHNSKPTKDIILGNSLLSALDSVGVSDDRGLNYGYVGMSDENYYINTHTTMPSCLLEIGFLTSDTDNEYFDKYLDQYAKSIANGIVSAAEKMGITDSSGKRLISGQCKSDKPNESTDSLDSVQSSTDINGKQKEEYM